MDKTDAEAKLAALLDTYCAATGAPRDQARALVAEVAALWHPMLTPGKLPALVARVQHKGLSPALALHTLRGMPELVKTRAGAELVAAQAFCAARNYGVFQGLLDKLQAYVKPSPNEPRH